jgi:hypothetical protein
MPYRLARWQWLVLLATFPIYCTLILFGVYGTFYLGYPPYTAAWLNHTKRPIVRELRLERPARLRLWGEISEGQLVARLDGKVLRVFVGLFDKGFVLKPGNYRLTLENLESSGYAQYSLQ